MSSAMFESDCLVSIKDVELGYGRRTVLRGVTFDISRGQFWCLVGRNGEGKTTLVNAILGLVHPRSGLINLDPSLRRLQHVGFVPQRCDPVETISTTVREFVLLGLVNLRCPRNERRERLSWALKQMDLTEKMKDDYWTLSSGQRQRALVARALIRRPHLLILDEATTGLDFPVERALLASLRKLNEQLNMTIILVTHDLTTVIGHASHVAVFKAGTVQAGAAKEIFASNQLRDAFGREMPVREDISDITADTNT